MAKIDFLMFKERERWDFSRFIGLISLSIIWTTIILFFSFIAFKGIKGLIHFNFLEVFGKANFSISGRDSSVSFWSPFGITLFLAFVVAIFAIPIGMRCAIFITFNCSKKFRKKLSAILLLFSNLPSIILGMFVRNYVSIFLRRVLGLSNTLNLITAIIALSCMIVPFVSTLFISALEKQKRLVVSSEVLGVDKVYSIYKILIPKIKNVIFSAVILVICRVFSESIMLSLILSSQNYEYAYSHGLFNFLTSQVNPVSSLISEIFFSDGSSQDTQNLMFLFGGALMMISFCINFFFMRWINRTPKESKITSKLPFLTELKSTIKWNISCKIFLTSKKFEGGDITIEEYIYKRSYESRFFKIFTYFRKSLEFISIGFFGIFVVSIVSTIFFEWIPTLFLRFDNSFPSTNGEGTLWTAILNTIFLVFLSMVFSVPIALFTTFYILEHFKKRSKFKRFTLAFMNASSSSPSIMYGIFGLSFFIHTLGWTETGRTGRSLLSGALTITFLILPYLTYLFHLNISQVIHLYREAAYTLGLSKYKTFMGIVVPKAISDLAFSILLAVGKIVGETAPLYLTAGLNSMNRTLLMFHGQTLTTRIYSQLQGHDVDQSSLIISETSFYCLLLLILIVVVGKSAIPFVTTFTESYRSVLSFIKRKIWRFFYGFLLVFKKIRIF